MVIFTSFCFVCIGIALLLFFFYAGTKEKQNSYKFEGIVSLLVCLAVAAGIAFGYPNYLVWEQGKQGEAALAKATQDRQIKVQEAEAEMEAAVKQAEANKTLGESIRAYPEAMEQKWVEAIANTSNQVIYLPTEASVPITEAGRMAQKKQETEKDNK